MAKKAAKKTTKKVVEKETSSKEVAVKQNTEVVTRASMLPADLAGAFDPSLMGATIDKDDIVIPKLWLLQAMSTCVTDDNHEAISGEYRNSRTLELKAAKGESLDCIVIDNYKTWQIFEEDEKHEMKYKETLNYYDHTNLSYDDVDQKTGRKIHRDLVLGFFVLLLDEVKAGRAFPYILDFKRTSRDAGKNLSTAIADIQANGAPSYAKVFSIGSEQGETTKEGKTYRFYRKKVSEGRWITREELNSIVAWVKELSKKKAEGKVKVDDSDVKSDDKTDTFETTATTKDGESRF